MMQIYLVRGHDDHEIVGIYWARSLDELWDIVDQLVDPFACDYSRLTTGGAIYTDAQFGRGQNPSLMEEPEIDWSGFQPDELLGATLLDWRVRDWKRFDSTDVGHGMAARARRRV